MTFNSSQNVVHIENMPHVFPHGHKTPIYVTEAREWSWGKPKRLKKNWKTIFDVHINPGTSLTPLKIAVCDWLVTNNRANHQRMFK